MLEEDWLSNERERSEWVKGCKTKTGQKKIIILATEMSIIQPTITAEKENKRTHKALRAGLTFQRKTVLLTEGELRKKKARFRIARVEMLFFMLGEARNECALMPGKSLQGYFWTQTHLHCWHLQQYQSFHLIRSPVFRLPCVRDWKVPKSWPQSWWREPGKLNCCSLCRCCTDARSVLPAATRSDCWNVLVVRWSRRISWWEAFRGRLPICRRVDVATGRARDWL